MTNTTYSTVEFLESPESFELNLSLAENLITSCSRKITCEQAASYAKFILEHASADHLIKFAQSTLDVCKIGGKTFRDAKISLRKD